MTHFQVTAQVTGTLAVQIEAASEERARHMIQTDSPVLVFQRGRETFNPHTVRVERAELDPKQRVELAVRPKMHVLDPKIRLTGLHEDYEVLLKQARMLLRHFIEEHSAENLTEASFDFVEYALER